MALGVIPPLCASLSPVLAGPEGCSRGRWRSGPSKWRHTATLGGRGQGAPRTCRCIETISEYRSAWSSWSQGAPRTCRCIETHPEDIHPVSCGDVREHHAPVGALRHERLLKAAPFAGVVREHHAPVGALRQKARVASRTWPQVREHHAPVGALRLPAPAPHWGRS